MRSIGIRIILFSVILISSVGCGTGKYIVSSNSNYLGSYTRNRYFRHGDFLPLGKKFNLNKVILIPESIKQQRVIKDIIKFLGKGKKNKALKHIDKYYAKSDYYMFARGVVLMSQENFIEARKHFYRSKNTDIKFLIDILIIDCEFDYFVATRGSIDYYSYLYRYQSIIDKYDLEEKYLKMLDNRMIFVREESNIRRRL